MKRYNFLLIGILVCSLFLVGCDAPIDDGLRSGSSGAGNLNNQEFVNSATQTTSQDAQPKILIEYSASKQDKIGESMFADEAQEGMTYLILDMDITNEGYKEFSTNSLYFSVVVDNIEYDSAWVTELEDELGTHNILNEGKLSGNLAFEVPEDVNNFEIVYDAWENYNIEYTQK